MIDERKLAELRKRLTGPADMEKVALQCASWWEIADTLAALWKVAKAARTACHLYYSPSAILTGRADAMFNVLDQSFSQELAEHFAALDDGKEAP